MSHRNYWHVASLMVFLGMIQGLSWSATTNPSPRATVRVTRLSDEKSVADVMVKGKSVIHIVAWAGGQSPQVRAERVAERLNEAFALGATHRTFKIEAPHFEEAIVAFGRPIITSTFEDQWATKLSRTALINQWFNNLIRALSQDEPTSQGDIVLIVEDAATNGLHADNIAYPTTPPPSNGNKAQTKSLSKQGSSAPRATKSATKRKNK